MKKLTLHRFQKEAQKFCKNSSGIWRPELYGVTDGKAIGTIVEHMFKDYLHENYAFDSGNSANGLDFPSLNTDLKVTSMKQPQSSCPFRDGKQKIFGLGYNLLLFVYDKRDDNEARQGTLDFVACSFIDKSRTADFQTTSGLLNIISNSGNQDDIFAYLIERNIPGDETTLYQMAEEILNNPPALGYLTISNALQWRLQYSRLISLAPETEGVNQLIKYNG